MLLLDVGNSRLKWAWLRHGALVDRGVVTHRGRSVADWRAELPAVTAATEAILVANVAGPAVAHEIGEWALANGAPRPRFVQSSASAAGVTNAYAHPHALGVDRWLALLGAWQRASAPLVTIGAGTALTVDALDAKGRHLGGWIVPGRGLLIDTLLKRTSDIAAAAALAPPRGDAGFGHNTAAAVENGATEALCATIERAFGRVAAATGVTPRVFLGGGDAALLAAGLSIPVEIEPDLVLEGLALLATTP